MLVPQRPFNNWHALCGYLVQVLLLSEYVDFRIAPSRWSALWHWSANRKVFNIGLHCLVMMTSCSREAFA